MRQILGQGNSIKKSDFYRKKITIFNQTVVEIMLNSFANNDVLFIFLILWKTAFLSEFMEPVQ
jgi:hypothetical protein